MTRVAERCNLHSTEDLLASLGFGAVTLHQVLNRLREEIRLQTDTQAQPLSNEDVARKLVKQQADAASGRSRHSETQPILGLEGLDYRLGGCCSPLPVRWNPAAMREGQRFPVHLRIDVIDRVGILKDILMRLSDGSINVSDARVKTAYGKPARIELLVELGSADLLQRTMDQIRSMADVLDIARTGQS